MDMDIGTREQVAAVLAKARELLIEDGWIRNHEHLGRKHCLAGAINSAAYRVTEYSHTSSTVSLQAQHVVENVLQKRLRIYNGTRPSIPGWNDSMAKNVDEVLEVLKLAEEEALIG